MALCAALCVYFALHRRWLLAGVPVLGIVAIATFDILAVEAFDLNSTFQNFARRYLSDADPQGASPLARRDIGFPLAFVYAIATYLVALVEFAVPTAFARWSAVTLEFAPGATVHLSPVSVGVIAAFAWSYFRGNLFTLDRLFLAAHLAVVALFSILWIKSGQIPTRYALPVYGDLLVPRFCRSRPDCSTSRPVADGSHSAWRRE